MTDTTTTTTELATVPPSPRELDVGYQVAKNVGHETITAVRGIVLLAVIGATIYLVRGCDSEMTVRACMAKEAIGSCAPLRSWP